MGIGRGYIEESEVYTTPVKFVSPALPRAHSYPTGPCQEAANGVARRKIRFAKSSTNDGERRLQDGGHVTVTVSLILTTIR